MRKSYLMVAALALVGALVASQSIRAEDKAAPQAKIGAPAPAFALQDTNGTTVSLSDFAGKIVVLEWINPECPFVVRHYKAKTMADLAEKYKGQDVVWLAINSTNRETKPSNSQWISQYGLNYPILIDRSGQVGRQYGAKTTPHMYIIDKQGVLVYNGGIDNNKSGNESDVVNYVDKALSELTSGQSVSTPETQPYGCTVKY
jgi:peroxiredoxin